MAGLTLGDIKRSPKLRKNSVVQLSDLMTPEEKAKRAQAKAKITKKRRKFDEIDAYSAEILARFGYSVWKDWNAGMFPNDKMRRFILAERARDERQMLDLEAVIIAMVGACIRRNKGEQAPQGPKRAQEIINDKIKRAKGED